MGAFLIYELVVQMKRSPMEGFVSPGIDYWQVHNVGGRQPTGAAESGGSSRRSSGNFPNFRPGTVLRLSLISAQKELLSR